MNVRLRTLSSGLYLNNTNEDSESRDIAYEYKVFDIAMLSVSVGVLTMTAIVCCVSYIDRWRDQKRVHDYERAVACDLEDEPVSLKVMQRSQSLHNPLPLFWPSESFRKDDSPIFFIYTNPLAVGCHQDNHVDPVHMHTTLTSNDLKGGIIMDPPTFHMQL